LYFTLNSFVPKTPFKTCINSGLNVGKYPEIILIEGSMDDQMKTSDLAQEMSVVFVSRMIVTMRYSEVKHTKLPRRSMKETAAFYVLDICRIQILRTGTARMHRSPKRLIIPTPR
jgi:hypothetical protein